MRFFKRRTSTVSGRPLPSGIPRHLKAAATAAMKRPVDIAEVREASRAPLVKCPEKIAACVKVLDAESRNDARNLLLGLITEAFEQ